MAADPRASEIAASPTPGGVDPRQAVAALIARALGELVAEKLSDAELVELRTLLLGEPATERRDLAVGVEYLATLFPNLGRAALYSLAARIPGRLDLDERRLMWSRRALDKWFLSGGGNLLRTRTRSRPAQSSTRGRGRKRSP
jgi:hypothetical protein